MFSRTMFRSGATRLISTSSRPSLTVTSMQSWTASKSWALAASRPRMYAAKTLAQKFLKGDWNCPECGFHNFAARDECKCGHPRKPTHPINSEKLPARKSLYSDFAIIY